MRTPEQWAIECSNRVSNSPPEVSAREIVEQIVREVMEQCIVQVLVYEGALPCKIAEDIARWRDAV